MAKSTKKAAKAAVVKEEVCEGCGNGMSACSCEGCGAGCGCGPCNCLCHHTFAIALILFGGLFLVANAGWLSPRIIAWAWPSIIVLAGLMELLKGRCRCC